jgi:hypothetical protein
MPAADDLVSRRGEYGQQLVDCLVDGGRVGVKVATPLLSRAAGDRGLQEAEDVARGELGMASLQRLGEALGVRLVEQPLELGVPGRASNRVAEVVAANCDMGVVDRRWNHVLLAQGREGGGDKSTCRGTDLGVGGHGAILRVASAPSRRVTRRSPLR